MLKLTEAATAACHPGARGADATSYEVYEDSSRSGGSFPTLTGSATSGTTGFAEPFPPESLLLYRVAGVNPCGIGAK